jgi:hypothetical protein
MTSKEKDSSVVKFHAQNWSRENIYNEEEEEEAFSPIPSN